MHIEVHIHLFELYAYVDTYGGAYPLMDEMNMSSVVKEHRSNSWSFVLLGKPPFLVSTNPVPVLPIQAPPLQSIPPVLSFR